MQPHYCCWGCDTPTGCPLRLEKLKVLENLENGPFHNLAVENWKTIGFSPALAGKYGVFLGLIIVNRIIR